MSIYGGKEMAASFRTVRKNTIQTAEEIPENQYSFRATPETRTVAETLVHIGLGPGWQHHIHSNRVDDLTKVNFMELVEKFTAEEKKTRNKAEIIAFLRVEGDKFASYLESLPDSFLAEHVAMPPGEDIKDKTRFEMLLGPKEHEMHHRAQLMTMQRMIGLVPHLTRKMNERMAQMQQQMQQQPTR